MENYAFLIQHISNYNTLKTKEQQIAVAQCQS